MKTRLLNEVGQYVTLENLAHADYDENKLQICIAGKLEYSEEYDNFFVRIGEDYIAGSMGITFKLSHVHELDKRMSGGLYILIK